MDKEKTDIKHFFIIVSIVLTILLGSSLTWNIYQEYQSANKYAKVEASASFNKDLLYRRWATMHGGVYVPITETTPPNSYLEFLPDRDITTSTGKKLTLVDHAYMTRQVHMIAESQYGIKGRITSLRPVRTENKADAWETKALKLFEKGEVEFSSIEKMDGKEYLRYMHSMKIENNCLKCHSNQGYKLGDIRGGISVSVPLDKYHQIAMSHSKTLTITYLLIYLLLITLSIFAYNRFLKEIIKRNLIQQKVIEREAVLHDSHEDLYQLLNSIYEGAYGVDINGNCTFVNRAFLRILGYQNEHEVLGKHMHELIHHSHYDGSPYPSSDCRIYHAYQTNQLINVSDEVFWRKDGVAIPVEYWSHPIEKDGVVIGSIATFIDITERKLAEEALKQLNSELENLHNNLDEAVFSVDIIHNKMLHVSIAHENVFGRSPEEFFNNPQLWYEIIVPEDKPIIDAGYPVLFSGKLLHHEYRIVHPDGQIRWIEAKMNPTLDTNGKLIRIDGIASNITDRKRAEQELIRAKEKAEESDKLKTAFLNNISHEIRTPFNGILGFLSILQNDDLTASERAEYTSIIDQSAFRLINTINDLIEMSQIQTGQMKLTASETNIKKLMGDLFDKFIADAESQGLEYTLNNDLPNDVEYISTDSTKLNTILSILIGNAIKFTKAGSVEFGIKFRDKAHLVYTPVGAIGEPFELEFSVKDTGIGIPIDRQEAVFERFMQADFSITRQFEGSGLGLSIAKAYVEMLGGKIWVESDPDSNSGRQGSTFYFTLPYNAIPNEKTGIEKVVSSDSTVNPINPEVSGLKILIVEDDETSELFLRNAIKLFSKEILNSRTGVETVEACRSNPDIDLILMDIKMPVMDGLEATRQIRQFNKGVIIIAQTAFGLTGDREKAIAAGCNDYISKPIKKDQLIELIQKYFL